MYEGAVSSMRISCGEIGEFPVTIGLSPYLFVLIMDELTAHIQKKAPWCMLFADDIVFVGNQEMA